MNLRLVSRFLLLVRHVRSSDCRFEFQKNRVYDMNRVVVGETTLGLPACIQAWTIFRNSNSASYGLPGLVAVGRALTVSCGPLRS